MSRNSEEIKKISGTRNDFGISGKGGSAVYKGEGFYFNTINSITIHDHRKELIEEVFSICDRFERLLSKTIRGSDVWRISHAKGQWLEVDDHTAVLIRKSLGYSRISKGLFDITIAPVSSLWNLKDKSSDIPSGEILSNAIAMIGYEQIELEGNRVRVPRGVELDLGGIAKGYIADYVAGYLRNEGVECALVDLGGNIYALGKKYDGSPWNIGIRDPFGNRESYLGIVTVSDKSVVTSGIYERSIKKGGLLYHHILNPKTGRPVENGLCSVTVVSERSIDADALSTACLLSGLNEGMELVGSVPGTEALFIDGTGVITVTPGMGKTVLYKITAGRI